MRPSTGSTAASAGAQAGYWTVTGTAFTDTGRPGTAEAVPTSAGTVWSVKNLFELKNARNVVIEENIFENHWKESQPGYAIVFTPRNSQGACTWCVVEHVRFERNVVRNVAAGINLLGYDSGSPSRQAADIAFRQNLFTDLSTSLGGNGWFLQIGDAPRDVVVEHNTIDSNGNAVVYAYGGTSADPREIYGFQMIANAARHGTYGINGTVFRLRQRHHQWLLSGSRVQGELSGRRRGVALSGRNAGGRSVRRSVRESGGIGLYRSRGQPAEARRTGWSGHRRGLSDARGPRRPGRHGAQLVRNSATGAIERQNRRALGSTRRAAGRYLSRFRASAGETWRASALVLLRQKRLTRRSCCGSPWHPPRTAFHRSLTVGPGLLRIPCLQGRR